MAKKRNSAAAESHRPDHTVADQSEVAAWLSEPGTYGVGVETVERIDTHGAMVFLAGERAYKIKRAVRYPYMDFSTLERRRVACEREVALNRRTAPVLYLAAEPVVRKADGTLAIGGEGKAIEWLVIMRRFDQAGLCDRLAEAGKLTAELMRDLADEVAAFHEAAEPVFGDGAQHGGGAHGMRAVIEENAEEMGERPDLFPETPALAADTLRTLERNAQLLDARLRAGLVRRCHGDLHLRNICVIDGRPVVFDCIEFNDEIACIDVLYDLAFLLMDLDHRGLREHANTVLNRYLQRRADVTGLAALPLFLSTRATVRAKVSVSMAAIQKDAAKAAGLESEARAYAAAARAYLRPEPARLVAVGGLSGTGKTSLARALAPEIGASPGALHLRSDVLRKTLAGVDELSPLPKESYTPETSARVYAGLLEGARDGLAAGRAVILDAVYARPAERAAVETMAKDMGVPFTGLWLKAPPRVLVERVTQRSKDASDATAPVVREQLEYDLGDMTWARIDAAHDLATTAERARAILGHDQASSG